MTQRQLHEFFSSSNIRSNNSTHEHVVIPPTRPSQPETTNETSIVPPAIIQIINELSVKYASLFCSSLNYNERLNSLRQHKTDGTIPLQMTFKFKKLFTQDYDTNLRSIIVNASIDQEITRIQTKLMELNTIYDNRLQELEENVTKPLNVCQITINPSQIIDKFNYTLQNKTLQFVIKQNKDKTKKQSKRDQFLSRKESDNEIVTLSKKQVQKLTNEIKTLQLAVKNSKQNIESQFKKNSKSNRNPSKNGQGGQISSTGGKKKNNGKKQFISKNK
jgi:hypothetical protein